MGLFYGRVFLFNNSFCAPRHLLLLATICGDCAWPFIASFVACLRFQSKNFGRAIGPMALIAQPVGSISIRYCWAIFFCPAGHSFNLFRLAEMCKLSQAYWRICVIDTLRAHRPTLIHFFVVCAIYVRHFSSRRRQADRPIIIRWPASHIRIAVELSERITA